MDTTAKHAVNDQLSAETAPAKEWLQIHVVARPGTTATLLRLTGELDATTGPELRSVVGKVLRGPAPGTVEIDAGGLTFLDSAGIRCLLICRKNAEAADSRLIVVDPSPCVYEVLAITGLLDLFAVTPRSEPRPATPTVPNHRAPTTAEQLIRQSAALRQAARETRQRAQAMRTDDALRRTRIRDRSAPE